MGEYWSRFKDWLQGLWGDGNWLQSLSDSLGSGPYVFATGIVVGCTAMILVNHTDVAKEFLARYRAARRGGREEEVKNQDQDQDQDQDPGGGTELKPKKPSTPGGGRRTDKTKKDDDNARRRGRRKRAGGGGGGGGANKKGMKFAAFPFGEGESTTTTTTTSSSSFSAAGEVTSSVAVADTDNPASAVADDEAGQAGTVAVEDPQRGAAETGEEEGKEEGKDRHDGEAGSPEAASAESVDVDGALQQVTTLSPRPEALEAALEAASAPGCREDVRDKSATPSTATTTSSTPEVLEVASAPTLRRPGEKRSRGGADGGGKGGESDDIK